MGNIEYEKRKEYFKHYRDTHKEQRKLYRDTHKEERKIWLENNREKVAKQKSNYEKNHREERNNRRRERRKNDNIYHFREGIRNTIRRSFQRRGYVKNSKAEEIVGITMDEFKNYIQNKFQEGMTFDNYGEWHLDHIIPLSSAKNEEEVIKLCHYTNFQPLWAKDNLKKSNKMASELE